MLLLRSPPSASGGAGGLAGEGELRTVQKCPRRTHLLPGLTQGSKPSHGICASYSKPGWFDQGEPTGMAAVFAKDAAEGFEHGSTTSVTAGSRIACGNCDAGRRRSVNANAGRNRRDGRSTPRRNGGDVPRRAGRRGATRPPRPPPRRLRILRSARGHAATGIRKFSAIGLDVTSPREMRAMRAIAARRARRPCGRRRTVNGSGCGATATWADSNAAWSTKRLAANAAEPLRPRSVPPRVRRGPRDRKVRSSFLDRTGMPR